MKRLFFLLITFSLLAASFNSLNVQAQLAQCRVAATIYKSDGNPCSGCTLKVTKVYKNGQLVDKTTRTYTTNSSGQVLGGDSAVGFLVPRGSIAWIYANSFGLDAKGSEGVPVSVPDASSATLETLVPSPTTLPNSYPVAVAGKIAVKNAGVLLSSAVDTIDFVSGATLTESPTGEVNITINAGVTSVFGRTGAVVAAANDYTFAQIGSTPTTLAGYGITDAAALVHTHSAADLISGTVPDARFPATLPAISGVNLTNLNASNLASGTVPLARLSGITNTEISNSAAIAYSKLNLTGAILNADLAGSIAISKLAITGTPNGSKFLRDDGSWQAISAVNPTSGLIPYNNSGTFADSFLNVASATSITGTFNVNSQFPGFLLTNTSSGGFGAVAYRLDNGTESGYLQFTGTSYSVGKAGGNTLRVAASKGIDLTTDVGAASGGASLLRFIMGGYDGIIALTLDGNANLLPGSSTALATNATNGFTYARGIGGVPVGTPGTANAGQIPLIVDSTNNTLYFYSNSAWRTAGGVAITALNGLTDASQTFSRTNDTNVTLTIASSAGNHAFTLGWTGTLAKARQHGATVYTDAGNTFSTGAQNFASATSLIIPTGAGLAPTANAVIAYDSTANVYQFGVNGVSKTVLMTDGSGASLTNLNASALASGTVPLGRLSGITNTEISNSAAIALSKLAITGTPNGSKFLRDDGSWQAIPGGGDALVANPLSQFASTTSAQLAGVLSDETGTGLAMFNSNPVLSSGLYFNGTTAGDILLKRSGITLGVRLGDDTGYANLDTGRIYALAFNGAIVSPTSIGSSQNNYAPDIAPIHRLTSSGAVNITGLDVTQDVGDIGFLVNVGSNTITLKNQDAASTATNRFLSSSGDVALAANEIAIRIYDSTTQRHRIAKLGGSGGGASVNPTSGTLPYNNAGTFADSLISQASGSLLFGGAVRMGTGIALQGFAQEINMRGTNTALYMTETGNGYVALMGTHASGFSGSQAGMFVGGAGATPISIINNSATRIYVDTSGLVGVNKNSSVGAQLHTVSGSASRIGLKVDHAASATTPVVVAQLGATPSSGGDAFQVRDSSGTTLTKVDSSGVISVLRTALGTTATDGLILSNTTAAAAGAQQVSPRVRWLGQGWKTDATAASQTVEWDAYVLPVQGAANPYGEWRLRYAVNGGAFSNAVAIGPAGAASFTKVAGNLAAGASTVFRFSTVGAVDADSGFWNGFQWGGHTVTESGSNRFPQMTVYSRSATAADPTDFDWRFETGNSSGLSQTLRFLALTTSGHTGESQGAVTFGSTGTVNDANKLVVSRNGNIGIGTVTFGSSAAKVLAIVNGTAPGTSITDGVQLYAQDVSSSSELRVRDEASNVTTLSPHNFSLIPGGRSEPMAWAFYSERDGVAINVDMVRVIRALEKLTGEQYIYIQKVAKIPAEKKAAAGKN